MRHLSSTFTVFVCSVLLLAACSARPPVLNSERIEARFGSYAVTVLAQDGRWRISSLESLDQGITTTRTFAIVRFAEPVPIELQNTHQRILAGASLGATLQTAGWQLHKSNVDISSVVLSDCQHVIPERMRIAENSILASHVYQIVAVRSGQTLPYATIAELHHPEYLRESDLQRIYGRAVSVAERDAMLAGLGALSLTADDCLVHQANGPTLTANSPTP